LPSAPSEISPPPAEEAAIVALPIPPSTSNDELAALWLHGIWCLVERLVLDDKTVA
jgi:hypothetical protein